MGETRPGHGESGKFFFHYQAKIDTRVSGRVPPSRSAQNRRREGRVVQIRVERHVRVGEFCR